MGMCNCNVKTQVIIHADYSVPFSQEDKVKFTNPNTKGISGTSISTSTLSKAKNANIESGCTQSQFRKTKRALLFQQISEKNSMSTTYQGLSLNVHGEASNNNCIKQLKRPLTDNEKKQLDIFINSFFYFKHLDGESIKKKLKLCTIEENKNIFLEGEEGRSMFIIISGKCELYKKGIDKVLIYNEWKTFGENCVCDDNSLRTYSVKTLTKLTFFMLDSADYWTIRKDINDTYEVSTMIQSIFFFSYLEDNDKENLSKFAYTISLPKSTQQTTLCETFYIIKSGKLECFDSNKTYQITIAKNMYYGVKNLLLNEQPTLHITPVEDTVIYIIPQKAFIEILGIDFQYNLIYPYFKHVMTNDLFFSAVFNELLLIPVFQLFKIKQYNMDSIVYKKGTKGKLIIIFEGELKFTSKTTSNDYDKDGHVKTSVKVDEIFGHKLVMSQHELDCDIKAKYNTILLECEWKGMEAKIKSLNTNIVKKINKLSTMEMMRGVSQCKLMGIATMVKKEKFNKKDIVIHSNNSSNEDPVKFYLVIKGEAKLHHKNKTIRRYGKGNSFGEVFMLNVQDPTDEIVASSDILKVYSIEQKQFLMLIGDTIFNDYIKHKMCNEDKEISINKLKYISKVNKSISIVRNSDEVYYAKSFIKSKLNYNTIKNEVDTLKHIDHMFIQKIVKIIDSTKTYGAILYENIDNGVFLSDISLSDIPLNNKDLVLFYSSCLLLVLDYLQIKKYIHRNISLDSIIIDKEGYMKLTNFLYAKKIKNGYTSSIVSLNPFVSPEILNKKSYSFACDYWSLGILMYYLYYKKYPFVYKSNDPLKVYDDITKTNFDYSNCSDDLKEIFDGLLCKEQCKRISSFKAIEGKKFYSNIDFDELYSRRRKPPVNINRKVKAKSEYKEMMYEKYVEKEIATKKEEANYMSFKWSESF